MLLAEHEGLDAFAEASEYALAESLPTWPAFPGGARRARGARGRGWRLAVLSNTDPDLLAASLEAIGVPFDGCDRGGRDRAPTSRRTATGSDSSSALPAPERGRHVHVAASLFHDIAPAAELGLPAVWINRLGETSDLPRAAELDDLSALPTRSTRIVPR